MAGVSTKEIKNRIRSMESTKQITKAMEMVAASKLRRAQTQVLNSRPYFETLYAAIGDIVAADDRSDSPYLQHNAAKKACFVVIGGDRGLAGGYNSNVFKLVMAQMENKDAVVLPIGRKAAEFFKTHGIPMLTETYCHAESVSAGDCFTIAKQLCKAYAAEEYGQIAVFYTDFVSVLTQIPTSKNLLPVLPPETKESTAADILYEPDSKTVLGAIIPEYVGGVIYGALCESRAAEQAARRTAMDSATQNAEEMIADLSLKFNRARQAAITQEITEIVAGA